MCIRDRNSFAIEANDNKLDENSEINLIPLNTWRILHLSASGVVGQLCELVRCLDKSILIKKTNP